MINYSVARLSWGVPVDPPKKMPEFYNYFAFFLPEKEIFYLLNK